jgi:hypothetical protein
VRCGKVLLRRYPSSPNCAGILFRFRISLDRTDRARMACR